MRNRKLIIALTGLLGGLVSVFVCAVAGVDFSASSKAETFQNQTDSRSSIPTNITQLSSAEIQLSQLRLQNQQLQIQLASCSAESSRLRIEAMTNQMNQQRR